MMDSKHASIAFMISLTLFLTLLDFKDLNYKLMMCGPNPLWAFTADIHETLTDQDLTQYLVENNGTRLVSHNQWNSLAQQCDSLKPYKINTMDAHLSALGTGCSLGGVKRDESLVFVSSIRIDSLVWGAGLIADIIHEPFPTKQFTSSIYGDTYNLPEMSYRTALAASIAKEDVAALNASSRAMFQEFGTREDLWEDALCYEIIPLPSLGDAVDHAIPKEYGCIWSDPEGGNVHTVHINETAGKYYRILSDWVGWGWLTLDYIHVTNLFMRARLRSVSTYGVSNMSDSIKLDHWIVVDLGVDGVLYFAMLLVELSMMVINVLDLWEVAILVVRPLVVAKRSSSYSVTHASSASEDQSMDSTTKNQCDKTLSRVLLYTDLTCVAFRKKLFAAFIVIDAFFSWIYIIPNSTLYAWSTNLFQVFSAYLSNFRVWTAVLIIIDCSWRFVFVVLNERVAALVTEFTHIKTWEIMIATGLAVAQAYQDLLSVCLMKWGVTDRQREMFLTTPGLMSFYNSYGDHTYGGRSNESQGVQYMYAPLLKIIKLALLYSLLFILLRLVISVSIKAAKGTLRKEVESFWRTYHRNSVETFSNDPLRANALVRSQSVMSYRFGRMVFIRPFVYLEQNYYIHHGRFKRRPLVALLAQSDISQGAEVNFKSYQLEGLSQDSSTRKPARKHARADTQIPLC